MSLALRLSIVDFWRSIVRVAVGTVLGLMVAWCCGLVAVGVMQRNLMYQPMVGVDGPANYRLADVAVDVLATADGERLVRWSKPAAPGKPTILYFHGNAGWMNGQAFHFRHFLDEGWGLSATAYRGFAGSTGSPTEKHLVDDGLLAYEALLNMGVASRDIVIYGESLGSGVAVQVAAARPTAAVVLESPFSSARDVASDHYWYLPVSRVMLDPFLSVDVIGKIGAPMLILAGATDTVIPIKYSRKLAAVAPAGSKYVEYPGGGHVDLFRFGAFSEIKHWIVSRAGAKTLSTSTQ